MNEQVLKDGKPYVYFCTTESEYMGFAKWISGIERYITELQGWGTYYYNLTTIKDTKESK